jgi:hypothetical protein
VTTRFVARVTQTFVAGACTAWFAAVVRWLVAIAVAGCAGHSDVAADAGCSLAQIPLVEQPSRLYVSVQSQSAPALLLVDTGSQITFLQEPLGSPDPQSDAGSIELGCETLELDGRPESPFPAVAGVPVLGTFGDDQLSKGPSKLDIANAVAEFHQPGDHFAEAASWPATGLAWPAGYAVVDATLDGTPLQLQLDTGAFDTIWVGQAAQPGDTETQTTDAYGDPITLYIGHATLTIGTWSGTVEIARAPSFPSFTQTWQELGVNVSGLFGLSSMGSGIVLDSAQLSVDER